MGGLAVAVAGGTGAARAAPRSSDWAALAASTPVAVVAPKTVADVQRCVAFAVKHRLRVATRSGRHSYTGASAASGLVVVDLRRLDRGIGYDGESGLVTVTPASTLSAVAGGLAEQGRSVPVGTRNGRCRWPHAGRRARGRLAVTRAHLRLPRVRDHGVAERRSRHRCARRTGRSLPGAARRGGRNFGIVTSLTFRTTPSVGKEYDPARAMYSGLDI